jgi:hypothetical protein
MTFDTCCSAFVIRSEEFPGEVEPEIQTVRQPTARELPDRRPLAVIEIDLKHVSARTFFERESVSRPIRPIAACPRLRSRQEPRETPRVKQDQAVIHAATDSSLHIT